MSRPILPHKPGTVAGYGQHQRGAAPGRAADCYNPNTGLSCLDAWRNYYRERRRREKTEKTAAR